ncbi:MAG: NAD(P)-dependent oxidoreductase [Candidatus Caenarcaniphilales bacterium]|nr:NAD(P)-dependent oxidoreductase [Candidatus Caenarcaniphilales bacterium]
MKVLLTGITSFTGSHIAREFLINSYYVHAPLLRKKEDYKALKEKRINLCRGATFYSEIDIQTFDFINLLENVAPDIYINHGAYVTNYRSDDFDFLNHLKVNLQNIKLLIETLKNNGCKLFIHSGSSFEPKEEYSDFGISPYGVAKKMVWDMTLFWCKKLGLDCTKVVIPNPYGLYENEDRLLPVFHTKISNSEKVTLLEPEVIRNNIEVEELSKCYVKVVDNWNNEKHDLIVRPKGHIESQKDFIIRSLQEKPYYLSKEQIMNNLLCS